MNQNHWSFTFLHMLLKFGRQSKSLTKHILYIMLLGTVASFEHTKRIFSSNDSVNYIRIQDHSQMKKIGKT